MGTETLGLGLLMLGAALGGLGLGVWLRTLRALSRPDDVFAVGLVSLFLAAQAAALLDLGARPALYLVAAVLLAYAPLAKIRQALYYPYSRLFFGRFMGHRGVLPHPRHAAGLAP